jgi:hypothetical protein
MSLTVMGARFAAHPLSKVDLGWSDYLALLSALGATNSMTVFGFLKDSVGWKYWGIGAPFM